jgi:hypothetical protein
MIETEAASHPAEPADAGSRSASRFLTAPISLQSKLPLSLRNPALAANVACAASCGPPIRSAPSRYFLVLLAKWGKLRAMRLTVISLPGRESVFESPMG